MQYVRYVRVYVCTWYIAPRKYVMIGHRFGQQSGQHQSSGRNQAAIFNGFAFNMYIFIPKYASTANIHEAKHTRSVSLPLSIYDFYKYIMYKMISYIKE